MTYLKRKSDLINEYFNLTQEALELCKDIENVEKVVSILANRQQIIVQFEENEKNKDNFVDEDLIKSNNIVFNNIVELDKKIKIKLDEHLKNTASEIKSSNQNKKAAYIAKNVGAFETGIILD